MSNPSDRPGEVRSPFGPADLAPGSRLTPGRPADDALLSLLVSMARTNERMHEREIEFLHTLRRDLPDRAAVEAWARSHTRHVDLHALAAAFATPDEQWKVLRYAARMAWKDGTVEDSERTLLTDLAEVLQLPPGAAERVLREMEPDRGQTFTADRIRACLLRDLHWDAVQLAAGALVSEDLIGVSPPNLEIIARVGLEKVEVMALATQGLVARFREGAAFLPWKQLVTYTRERGLGEALRLHTEDGRSFTLVDSRLAGLAFFLDRLFDPLGGNRETPPPKIDTLRGEGTG